MARVDTLRSTYSDNELTQLIAKGKKQKKGIGSILDGIEGEKITIRADNSSTASFGYVNREQVFELKKIKNPKKDLIITEHSHNQIRKGNYGEMTVDVDLEFTGDYKRISKNRVTSFESPTHHGIDGIYKNSNPPPDYIIIESKYMGADKAITEKVIPQLSNTKGSGKQLSKQWTLDNINNAIDDEEIARAIRKQIVLNKNTVISIAAKVDNTGKITYYHVDSTGKVLFTDGKALTWKP